MNHSAEYIFAVAIRAAYGLLGAILAVGIMPWQEQLEWGVRVAGGMVGVAVGVMSVVAICRGMSRRNLSERTDDYEQVRSDTED